MADQRTDETAARDHRSATPQRDMAQPFERSGAKDPAAARMDPPLESGSGVRTEPGKEEDEHGDSSQT